MVCGVAKIGILTKFAKTGKLTGPVNLHPKVKFSRVYFLRLVQSFESSGESLLLEDNRSGRNDVVFEIEKDAGIGY